MITFNKIRYKNFLSTGDAFTELQFDKSESTLVVGENGAGKSTFLDALCFGIYGKPFRNVNKPQLVNTLNGKGLLVELDFTIGKNKYKVRRGIKPNIFEIYTNDKKSLIADLKDFLLQIKKFVLHTQIQRYFFYENCRFLKKTIFS